MSRLEAEPILAGLKDFQRATVEHAFHRLFDARDSTRRFLVADEVGLGKTLVARGVVAKAIERLQAEGVDRIDVVYICSNADIARQNTHKLDVAGIGTRPSSRLTLLATNVRDLRRASLNIVALTPGTSFSRGSATGQQEERVLLYWMLRNVWDLGRGAAPMNLLQATTIYRDNFRDGICAFDTSEIDREIAHEFARSLEARCQADRDAGRPTIRERFEELLPDFRRARRQVPKELRRERDVVISDLRGILAAASVEALEPDLVILDEFQRFKHLLEDDGSEAASLAQTLFRWERPETHEHARVLLLSATPYRALTVAGDGGDDDHYADFLATVRFLCDDERRVEELRDLLRAYQDALYGATEVNTASLHEAARAIEELLSRYIARTERVGADASRDAMLVQRVREPQPEADDLRQYVLAQDVAAELGQPDITELWKSAPYLLNFLDGYQLRARFDAACKVPDRAQALAELLHHRRELLLDQTALTAYAEVDPGTPRLRELAEDVIATESWRLLWVPPTLPYHELGGAYAQERLDGFTKRLVFSAWRAVPRAVAGMLSYLAERAMVAEADPGASNTPERRAAQRDRLVFTAGARGRLTGMPALALLYPSPALARAADPRELAAVEPVAAIERVLDWARSRIEPLIDDLPEGTDGATDRRWYWAAPLLLDAPSGDWWGHGQLAAQWADGDPRASTAASHWSEHVALAHTAAQGALDPPLGKKPRDLAQVLAEFAVGGPGTLALRTICRVTGLSPASAAARLAAGRIAWALRGLFNSPEATALLRASRTEFLWREVLGYAIQGDLQAVLDEHAHLLRELECSPDDAGEGIADAVATAMIAALTLRSSRVTYSDLDVDKHTVTPSNERLYTSFAMRFGDEERSAQSGETPARANQLREAFNSPYWPFVLATTAVGQEGLDFHPYCHVVVHWNLPRNPVDLEQREGRVHRYKGHAIRKNVARHHAAGALAAADADPWTAAFALASADRPPGESELVPFWIYCPSEDAARIERHVLALPLSRELGRLSSLRDALAVYRLAFGQARQEDIIDHLLQRLGPERARELASEVRIDLRPPVRPPLSKRAGKGSRPVA